MRGWSSKTSSVLGCSRMSQRGGPEGEETHSESRWAALFLCQPCRSMLPTINRPVILHTRCFIYLDHDWGKKKTKPVVYARKSHYELPLHETIPSQSCPCYRAHMFSFVYVNLGMSQWLQAKKKFLKPIIKLGQPRDVTGGSVAKTPYSQSRGLWFNP